MKKHIINYSISNLIFNNFLLVKLIKYVILTNFN